IEELDLHIAHRRLEQDGRHAPPIRPSYLKALREHDAGPVVGSSSTEKMLPHKRCQSFGQGGLLWLPSIGGIWDLFTCSTGAIEIPKTREKVSHVLAIRPLKPAHSFHVDFLRRSKADLNGHRLVNLRWLESSAGLRPIETESEID